MVATGGVPLQGGYSEPDRGDLEAITLKEDRWCDRFPGDFIVIGPWNMVILGRFFSLVFWENVWGLIDSSDFCSDLGVRTKNGWLFNQVGMIGWDCACFWECFSTTSQWWAHPDLTIKHGDLTQSKNVGKMEIYDLVGGLEHEFYFFHILGMSSSQLTNSYFSEGWLNHQPVMKIRWASPNSPLASRIFPSKPPFLQDIFHCHVWLPEGIPSNLAIYWQFMEKQKNRGDLGRHSEITRVGVLLMMLAHVGRCWYVWFWIQSG